MKPAHTVNDGAAKTGANSFTQKQAQEHIEKSGFTGVSNLVKGDDGVWRGQATRGGSAVDVAMDFKGNVSTPGAAAASRGETSTTRSEPAASQTRTSETTTTTETTAASDGRTTHRRRHHRHAVACANPAPTARPVRAWIATTTASRTERTGQSERARIPETEVTRGGGPIGRPPARPESSPALSRTTRAALSFTLARIGGLRQCCIWHSQRNLMG